MTSPIPYLFLLTAALVTTTAAAAPGTPPKKLATTMWEAEKLNGKDATNVVVIEFKDGKNIIGNLGCNIVRATYKLGPKGELRIDSITTSKRTCPSTIVAEQERFVVAFKQTRSVRSANETLWLLDDKDNVLAQFIPPTGDVDCH